MLTKSRCGRNDSIFSAAAGTSTIIPTRSPAGTPSGPAASARISRAATSSRTVETIGNITSTGASPARRGTSATSWSREEVRAVERRAGGPRSPRNGFASGGIGEVGQRLVAADVERAHRRTPAAERRGDGGVLLLLLVDVGGGARGPGRGTRCGPARTRRRRRRTPTRASATDPRLAATTTVGAVARRPPARWPGRGRGRGARPARGRGGRTRRPRRAPGRRATSPVAPSTTTGVPSGTREHLAPGRRRRRDAAGPGQDRGVRRRAPGGQHDRP